MPGTFFSNATATVALATAVLAAPANGQVTRHLPNGIEARNAPFAKKGRDVYVAVTGNEVRGFGNMLLIKHDGGWVTAYAHNEKLLVKRGEKVKRGQAIAQIGSTGNVSAPQLHFEIRKGSTPVDPAQYLGGA